MSQVIAHPMLLKQFLELAQSLDTSVLKLVANYLVMFVNIRETDNATVEARQVLSDLKQKIIGRTNEESIPNRKEPRGV